MFIVVVKSKVVSINNLVNMLYSPKNTRMNLVVASSICKPEISSDSPSEKSKGARDASATSIISHIASRGRSGATFHLPRDT